MHRAPTRSKFRSTSQPRDKSRLSKCSLRLGSAGALRFLEARTPVGLRSEQGARYGDVVGRDLEHLAKDALSGRSFGDGDYRRVMAISARGVRASLDRNDRPMHVLRRCAVGLDVHETAAG